MSTKLIAISLMVMLLAACDDRRTLGVWKKPYFDAGCGKHGRAVNSEPVDVVIEKYEGEFAAPLTAMLSYPPQKPAHIVTCSDGSTVLVSP